MRAGLLLVLLLAVGEARADVAQDALALARATADAHRSEEHKARMTVAFPAPGAVPGRGEARLEARSGRYALEQTGYVLVLEPEGARLSLVSWTHIPVFAARAARKRDPSRLLEARVPVARARTVLLALELLAAAHEKPKDETALDPLDPRYDEPEATREYLWPRLAVTLDGRHAPRRGEFAELARYLLEDLGKEQGLAPPLERDAALRRLLPAFKGGGDGAARAAFVLGDAAFPEAYPALAALGTEEARDACEKIAALAAPDARPRLLELSTRSASWDVRAWARERLASPRGSAVLPSSDWRAALLAAKAAPEDALVEAIAAVDSADALDRLSELSRDARPLVQVEAAGALLRLVGDPRARATLVQVAASASAPTEARETAVARLSAALRPGDLAEALAPILADPGAPASVRSEAVRGLDQSEAVGAEGALAQALDLELTRRPTDDASHDLRLALVAALSTIAAKTSILDAKDEVALEGLGHAAQLDPDDEVRAVAIHAAGALASEEAGKIVKTAAEAEGSREPASPRARHAAELEAAARADDEMVRLLAIADAACEAPVRSALERLVRAARAPRARAVLEERLRARGEEGEAALEVLERR
jgi:hypothetical protein